MELFAAGLAMGGLLAWIITGKWKWGVPPLIAGILVGFLDLFL